MSNKGLLAILAVIAGGIMLTRKETVVKPPLEPGVVPKEGFTIGILDMAGNPVPHNSPYQLTEYSYYQAVLTVTNRSTKGGSPTPHSFMLSFHSSASGALLLKWGPTAVDDYVEWRWDAGAGETISFTQRFATQLNTAGYTGQIQAYAMDLAKTVKVAQATVPYEIVALAIVRAVDLTITL